MSIFSTLQTAVSGMAAQASKLGTIGDNIANQSTTGYKDSSMEFETLLGDSSASNYESGGVQGSVRYNITGQGELASSTAPYSMAVQGNGFFVVQTDTGAQALTRAGAFVQNSSGNLVNTAGATLMGYSLTDGSYNAAAGNGTLKAINVSNTALAATPSTAGSIAANLPSTAATGYTATTSLIAYDNLGTAVKADITMTKTGDNTWDITATNDADGSSLGNTLSMTFDPTTGKVVANSDSTLSLTITNGNTVAIDMSGTTQLAAAYDNGTQTIDGSAPSKVTGTTISTDGTLSLTYANGKSVAAYKIPLATVASPNNLSVESGNLYQANGNSGPVVIGAASSGTFGKIEQGELESSTVDLATQLTSMISTQRSYEANSKVLTTGSDMLNTIIQAIR